MVKRNKAADANNAARLPADQKRIIGLAASTLGRSIVWSLTQRTARYGVFPGIHPVIAWLMQLSESTQSELSRLIGIEQPTMAVTLKRMERDGFISRTPDPAHGRRATVKLTPKGRKLSQVMTEAAHEVEKLATKGLSAKEVDDFFRIVGIMTQNLNAERYGER